MAYQFKLPDIGEGIAEGEIVKWFTIVVSPRFAPKKIDRSNEEGKT